MEMRENLIGILSAAASYAYSLDTRIETEKLADFLIENDVTILPEGAIILTKEEIAALNEYQSKHGAGGEPVEK